MESTYYCSFTNEQTSTERWNNSVKYMAEMGLEIRQPGSRAPCPKLPSWTTSLLQETGSIPGLGRSPREGVATHSSILAWRIPWTEEPGRLRSTGSQRVGHDWYDSPHIHLRLQQHVCACESEVKVQAAQSCLTLCDPMYYTVHGILQARILEWVALPFSRGSSQPRDQTQVSRIAGRFFTCYELSGKLITIYKI